MRDKQHRTCVNCTYWNENSNGTVLGDCRRRSPRINWHNEPEWPKTTAIQWCGEFDEYVNPMARR